jgi:hypothetical protein
MVAVLGALLCLATVGGAHASNRSCSAEEMASFLVAAHSDERHALVAQERQVVLTPRRDVVARASAGLFAARPRRLAAHGHGCCDQRMVVSGNLSSYCPRAQAVSHSSSLDNNCAVKRPASGCCDHRLVRTGKLGGNCATPGQCKAPADSGCCDQRAVVLGNLTWVCPDHRALSSSRALDGNCGVVGGASQGCCDQRLVHEGRLGTNCEPRATRCKSPADSGCCDQRAVLAGNLSGYCPAASSVSDCHNAVLCDSPLGRNCGVPRKSHAPRWQGWQEPSGWSSWTWMWARPWSFQAAMF